MLTGKPFRRIVVRSLCLYLVIGALAPLDWPAKGVETSARPISQFPPSECTTTQIKISEVEQDPTGTEPGAEWFELFNTGSGCTMTSWTIRDNYSTDTIPTLAIAASGHVIVAASKTAFIADGHSSVSGAIIEIGGPIGNGLANNDRLVLKNGSGTDVDCVSWGDDSTCGFAITVDTANNKNTAQRTPTDGTDTDSANDWKVAAETPLGTPTVVHLMSFTARSTEDGVFLQWETVSESDIAGFDILRSTVRDGPYIRLNDTLILSQAFGGLGGASYVYTDQDVTAGVVYYYLLQVVNADGSMDTFGPIQVVVGSG